VRIFSGIQPTGRKHLGNYIGAIRQYVEGQDRGEAIYCIVDLHAITVAYDPEDLRRYVLDTTAMMLAAVTAHGDLNRMHQFKEKSARQRELISAGLFLYPVLQAADILAYDTDEVPVGDDQRQHIELTRDIALRFNERFGETLVVPAHRIPEIGARIMDLQDPAAKMSTTAPSEQGTLLVLEEESAILKKLKRAVTDAGSEVSRAPDKPGISNLIDIYAVVRGVSPEAVEAEFSGRGYGDFKAAVGEAVVEYLRPVRERYAEMRPDEAGLESVLADGAERARKIASGTLARVRAAMGVGSPA